MDATETTSVIHAARAAGSASTEWGTTQASSSTSAFGPNSLAIERSLFRWNVVCAVAHGVQAVVVLALGEVAAGGCHD